MCRIIGPALIVLGGPKMQEIRKLLRDDQWEKLSPLLPGKPSDPVATAQDNRLFFFEAVLWIVHTGSWWRDLPAELGN